MNVLYSPRMPENTVGVVFTQNARKHCRGWLECVFRPCYRYKKHTKPSSWPINLNLCPASWLRVTALTTLMASIYPSLFHCLCTYPTPLIWHIYIKRRVNLFNNICISMIRCNLQWLPFILT